jgi:protein-L-isoaspartate(D-aspartate) O-methyltransferase
MLYSPRHIQTRHAWQLLIMYLTVLVAFPCLADDYQHQRQAMIELIEADVRRTSLSLDTEKLDENVLDAMQRVPRHKFVPPEWQDQAYENRPLPIGYGQTISQPYIVAIMTDLLKPEKGQRVLEIGTGSGYQAAILAELTANVFTMEIIESLGDQARKRLQRLGYQNVEVRIGDGYFGWEEQAPFDAIVVTAAASQIPPPLVKQLKPGGRMIIPVGSPFMVQQLVLVEKDLQGTLSVRQILPVRFVPLTGSHDE